ncbi:hypothetical protein FIBSPDRAFT_814333 [Athelia psychrophila]|uniref:BTB domain-containing protein n=1 Tax=Athelia psychrophila TaxID=1759441 RepID=A0A166TRK4_9AGAM|nr:hypothetical protein FIBSPDRAFT_814333 [Fibularhizoctonia sp. CBS 109695]
MRSDIWYEDVNVILQAGSTQFKVHRSILAENSTVFKDMFSFPQPPSANQELLEGCQIVRLSDTAEEVRHAAPGKPLPLPILSAFFFLGRKYGIRTLFIEAQERLYKEFPLDLEDMEAATVGGWGVIKDAPYVDLAIFARKAGLLSILPHILYGCCDSYTPREITGGVLIGLSDDSVRYLPPQDQIICLSGYQAIFKAQAETTYRWIRSPDHFYFCCACYSSRSLSLSKRFTPLLLVSGLDTWDDSDFDYCGNCVEGAKMEHRIGREEFWELLPSLFDLPSWEELRKERQDLLREGTNCKVLISGLSIFADDHPQRIQSPTIRLSYPLPSLNTKACTSV